MAIRMVKAVFQDDKHIETKQSIKGVRLGQEVEVFIHFEERLSKGKRPFSFLDHDFGIWRSGRIRREEIYHEDGR